MPNTDLVSLNPDTVADLKTDKMRRDLQVAHDLAAENQPLSYYKEELLFQEELLEKKRAQVAKAAATPKGKKKKGAPAEDDDLDMLDVADEEDEDARPAGGKKAASKKRKAAEAEVRHAFCSVGPGPCGSPSRNVTSRPRSLLSSRHKGRAVLGRGGSPSIRPRLWSAAGFHRSTPPVGHLLISTRTLGKLDVTDGGLF